MFSLLDDIIDVIAFRQFLTKGQKIFFFFFYAILGSILFVCSRKGSTGELASAAYSWRGS